MSEYEIAIIYHLCRVITTSGPEIGLRLSLFSEARDEPRGRSLHYQHPSALDLPCLQ